MAASRHFPLLLAVALLIAKTADATGDFDASSAWSQFENAVREINQLYSPPQNFPFRNTSLPWSERVADLIKRLSTAEVIIQLSRGGAGVNGPAPAIPRLAIGPYNWDTECLHGVAQAGPATSFPQAIGLSASFNPAILWRVANATGAEARAKHIDNNAHGKYGDHTGMSCFAPVVNIMRHPLWGRNQETYGEDTFLSAQMADAYVKGLQGNRSSRYFQATATCKHFDAHSGPENIPVSRLSFNAIVSQRDFALTYFPAFEACISAGARGVMCSYNSINGVPACADGWLLTEVLRRRWKFPGYVVSDEGALEFMISFHHAFKDPTVAAAAALNAGVNLELAPATRDTIFSHLPAALKQGWINETFLREMLTPLFETRMRLGEFDPSNLNPYASYKMSELVQSQAHRSLSLEAALSTFVLLKNVDSFLPWSSHSPDTAGLLLIGPFGINMSQLYGDYAADRMPEYEVTVEAGLQTITSVGAQLNGCLDGPTCKQYDDTRVRQAVASAKVIVLTIGTGQAVEAEGNDRVSLELPNRQVQLLADVLRYSQPSARILILIFSASPIAIHDAVTSTKVKSILWCGFPGQTAGAAVAAAISPEGGSKLAGRLPFTWYANDSQVPSRTDYLMHNQTYRYLPAGLVPQFPFGFGLSMGIFAYDRLAIPTIVNHQQTLRVQVRVTNTGKNPGQEVVQVYIRWPTSEKDMPRHQMVGIHRTGTMHAGQSQTLVFNITPKQRQVWRNNNLQTFTGELTVFVGGQQPEQNVKVPSNVLRAAVKVV